ncbi:hypothetical protein niasHT_021382 [Heterodera trifolii]|uniref:Uncharacterized protein n=1 Tax=Heterodera trifolii TaxID=157864 RepID=A0ABD2K6K4_9BILA
MIKFVLICLSLFVALTFGHPSIGYRGSVQQQNGNGNSAQQLQGQFGQMSVSDNGTASPPPAGNGSYRAKRSPCCDFGSYPFMEPPPRRSGFRRGGRRRRPTGSTASPSSTKSAALADQSIVNNGTETTPTPTEGTENSRSTDGTTATNTDGTTAANTDGTAATNTDGTTATNTDGTTATNTDGTTAVNTDGTTATNNGQS